jgi:hypothetical protein
MCPLFSLNAAERRRGKTELLEAAVLEIVTLTISKAYARFKCGAHACNLCLLCTRWATITVQCIELDPKSIRVAHELVHLSVGNLGILRQIRDSDGAARFCRCEQLGRTEMVRLITGDVVRCTFSRTWPLSPDATSSGRVVAEDQGRGGGAAEAAEQRALVSWAALAAAVASDAGSGGGAAPRLPLDRSTGRAVKRSVGGCDPNIPRQLDADTDAGGAPSAAALDLLDTIPLPSLLLSDGDRITKDANCTTESTKSDK